MIAGPDLNDWIQAWEDLIMIAIMKFDRQADR
jgi:hypothetical protein